MKDESKFKVLFIDDEPASLTAFKSVFRDYYSIILASSAQEGYDIMKKEDVDIVISDQRMPGISGVEFLQKIRVEFPETVRMLITGYSDIDAVVQSINGSMISYYFSKPYDTQDMKVILDNTVEKIKLMKENRTLFNQLQGLVKDLTIEKENLEKEIVLRKEAESELLVAREKAEESSRLKSSLLANMSHEFRTPMNSILGFSQILKDGLDDDFKNMAENINISGKRLLKTLNAIVDLARFEADKKAPNLEVLNLSELLSRICSEFREAAERKKLIIRDNISPDVCSMFNNSFANLIITNLIDNAIKFTSEGSIEISLDVDYSGESAFSVFQVRDSGIGIPTEFHKKVFEDFRQVSEGMGRSFEGLGIGLSLSKKLLDRLNGEILLESEVGKGTTFTVKIPYFNRNKTSAPEQFRPVGETVTPAFTTPSGFQTGIKPSILIVEDNEYNLELMEMFLQKLFVITKSDNGETAIDLVKENHYDTILMDINLGAGIDGIQTLNKIRDLKGKDSIPVIAVTGYTSMDEKQKLLESGFNSFLPKPFSQQSLISVIQKHIMS